jgi:hypothetical protein
MRKQCPNVHIASIYLTIDAHSKAEATAYARHHYLV